MKVKKVMKEIQRAKKKMRLRGGKPKLSCSVPLKQPIEWGMSIFDT